MLTIQCTSVLLVHANQNSPTGMVNDPTVVGGNNGQGLAWYPQKIRDIHSSGEPVSPS